MTKALDEELLEDMSVPANDLWRLLITKCNEYNKRYHKGRGLRQRRLNSRHKPRRHRSSSSSHKGKKSRRSRRSRSSSIEKSSGSGSESSEETYYRGKFKFVVRVGTEDLIANNGRECRTDKRPPPPPRGLRQMWRTPLGVALWQRQVEKMTGDSGGVVAGSQGSSPGSTELSRWFDQFVAAREDSGSVTWWSGFLQSWASSTLDVYERHLRNIRQRSLLVPEHSSTQIL